MTRPLTANPSALHVNIAGGNWRDHAACTRHDPELWFVTGDETRAEHRADIDAAKGVCGGCPVLADCLQVAMMIGDRYAIAGGLTPRERTNLKRRRQAA